MRLPTTKMVILKDKKMLNPKTGRLICVGSPTWRKLVLEGVLPNKYEAVDVLADAPEDDYERERLCAKLSSTLGEEFTARRGTGMYKDKIIKIRKPPTQKYTLDKAKKAAKKIIAEKIDEPMEEDDEEIEKLLNENFARIAVEQRKPKTSKLKKTYKIKKAPTPEPSSASSDSDNEEEPAPKEKPKKKQQSVSDQSSTEDEKPKKKAIQKKMPKIEEESDFTLDDTADTSSDDE